MAYADNEAIIENTCGAFGIDINANVTTAEGLRHSERVI